MSYYPQQGFLNSYQLRNGEMVPLPPKNSSANKIQQQPDQKTQYTSWEQQQQLLSQLQQKQLLQQQQQQQIKQQSSFKTQQYSFGQQQESQQGGVVKFSELQKLQQKQQQPQQQQPQITQQLSKEQQYQPSSQLAQLQEQQLNKDFQQSSVKVNSKSFQSNFKKVACSNSSFCSEQISISKSMINYDKQTDKFYGTKICKCNAPTYFLWCDCGQEILSNKPFFQGQLLKCSDMKCLKTFQIVRCPSQNCLKFDVFNNNTYEIGMPTACRTCQMVFQQVPCNECYESTYFESEYIPTKPYKCSSDKCKNSYDLQQVNCPQDSCKQSNFFNIRKPLLPLKAETCTYCTKPFIFVPCAKCRHSVVLPFQELENGVQYECKNCSDKVSIDYCFKSKHLNVRQNPSITSNYGRRECSACSTKYIILKCSKCVLAKAENPVIIVNQDSSNEQNVFKMKCKCDKESFFITCPKCKGGYSLPENDLSKTSTVECKICHENVEHNMKVAIEGVGSISCKICMEKPAAYFIDTCGHLFGCEDCANNLKVYQHSERVKCPICRAYGKIGRMYM